MAFLKVSLTFLLINYLAVVTTLLFLFILEAESAASYTSSGNSKAPSSSSPSLSFPPVSSPNPNLLQPQFIHDNKITLSGFSSGGTFAQQLQFSYSSLFSGIAVFSHTYYRCGPPNGNLTSYDSLCTKLFNFTEDQLYNPQLVHQDIQDYLRRGLIEDTRNLRNTRLYVYTGLRNFLFSPRQSLSIVPIYERYIVQPENIFVRVQDANLVLPTSGQYGAACTEASETTFFIGRCNFPGLREALDFLLFWDQWGGIKSSKEDATSSSSGTTNSGFGRPRVSTFDQTEFTRGLQNHQMDNEGYYYIPRRCRAQRCYLHFYFHGCLAGKEFANATHVENTGLLELADRYGLIIIFPQARSSQPQNEIGCWDTFGIGGVNYATQRGPQVTAVKRMIDRLLGKVENLSFGSSSSWPFQFGSGSGSSSSSGSSTSRNINSNGNSKPPKVHRYSPYLTKPSSTSASGGRSSQLWSGRSSSQSWRQSSNRQ